MIKHAEIPPIERLEALFELDADRGLLIHKKKCGIKAGAVAGSPMPQGYLRAKADGRLYLVHRLIYAMYNKQSPGTREVDHINGNKKDNRPCNLRLATRNQNRQNVEKYISNSTGYRGIWYDKARNCFFCAIQANGVRDQFGPFETAQKASEVYISEAKTRFGEFYREVN